MAGAGGGEEGAAAEWSKLELAGLPSVGLSPWATSGALTFAHFWAKDLNHYDVTRSTKGAQIGKERKEAPLKAMMIF